MQPFRRAKDSQNWLPRSRAIPGLSCRYQEEGGGGCAYNSVSIGSFCEVSIYTNTSKYRLFDALKTAENDGRVLENLEV
jgi:hypothetical protein